MDFYILLDFRDRVCYTFGREQTDGLVLGQSPSFIITPYLFYLRRARLLVFFLPKNITNRINREKNTWQLCCHVFFFYSYGKSLHGFQFSQRLSDRAICQSLSSRLVTEGVSCGVQVRYRATSGSFAHSENIRGASSTVKQRRISRKVSSLCVPAWFMAYPPVFL